MIAVGGTMLVATCGSVKVALPLSGLVEMTRPAGKGPPREAGSSDRPETTWRGRRIPVVDVSEILFGVPSLATTRIVVVCEETAPFALAFDSVQGLSGGVEGPSGPPARLLSAASAATVRDLERRFGSAGVSYLSEVVVFGLPLHPA